MRQILGYNFADNHVRIADDQERQGKRDAMQAAPEKWEV